MCVEDQLINSGHKVPIIMVYDGTSFKVLFDEDSRPDISREQYEDSLR